MALHHPPSRPCGCAHPKRSGTLLNPGDVRPVAGRCRSRRGDRLSGVAQRAIRVDGVDAPAGGTSVRGHDHTAVRRAVSGAVFVLDQGGDRPDQLRQRAMYSLSQLFVISMVDNNVMSYPQGIATYMDVLGRDAFGNFRQLLEDVTLSPMMGLYLSHLGNQKEDAATGRVPDENFAREVMQLFTIGLVELNADGTVKLDSRREPIETYSNDDVIGLARVFTGWSWSSPIKDEASFQSNRGLLVTDERALKPMEPYPQFHSTSPKAFLGKAIPAGTGGAGIAEAGARSSVQSSERRAFHRQTADPAPGDQQPEPGVRRSRHRSVQRQRAGRARRHACSVARDPAGSGGARCGKAQRSAVRQAARAGAAPQRMDQSVQRQVDVGQLNVSSPMIPSSGIGQAPLRSPSVFNFYRPGYVPPNTGAATPGWWCRRCRSPARPVRRATSTSSKAWRCLAAPAFCST